ncbi:MAG: serpin family protein [Ethanoligenens sp.]
MRLPRFKVTADENLNQTLSQMGLSSAFGDRADFSEMTNDRSLYISNVRQKTVLEVDELGTKAAAATAAGMTSKSAVLGKHINFDRPFVFAVVDLKTNLPLFIGTKQE